MSKRTSWQTGLNGGVYSGATDPLVVKIGTNTITLQPVDLERRLRCLKTKLVWMVGSTVAPLTPWWWKLVLIHNFTTSRLREEVEVSKRTSWQTGLNGGVYSGATDPLVVKIGTNTITLQPVDLERRLRCLNERLDKLVWMVGSTVVPLTPWWWKLVLINIIWKPTITLQPVDLERRLRCLNEHLDKLVWMVGSTVAPLTPWWWKLVLKNGGPKKNFFFFTL